MGVWVCEGGFLIIAFNSATILHAAHIVESMSSNMIIIIA